MNDPRESNYTGDPLKLRRVLAYSGGLDSTALLVSERIDVAVYVDYGHPAAEAERRAARTLTEMCEVELVEVKVSGLALGPMADATGASGMRVVPARNALIAAICANHIGDHGGYVYFGAHAGDACYPDCTTNFFDFLSVALGQAYNAHILVPLILKTKLEVLTMLGEYMRGYDFACWSCYTPRAGDGDELKPCLECDSCKAAKAAELDLACL